ncbi:hypothetical protein [Kouleothrix sp.]|uniref:hypothetical protein n=1 Tax=Kouleothrix sp. TaxID=2779161 RepID=UPI00391D1D30
MLSPTTQKLTYLTAGLFALMGLALFAAPSWAAANAAWKITPFAAMTMGGWYLGGALMAFEAARNWDWSVNHTPLIFTWAFSALEAGLLVVHRQVLHLDTAFGIAYTIALAISAVATLASLADWARARPRIAAAGGANPWWSRALAAVFVIVVAFFAIPLLIGSARGGTIWPSELTLLTARSFGAFFLALVLSIAPLMFSRGMAPVVAEMRPGIAMSALIGVAALVFIGDFDFGARPLGIVYIGAYVATIAGAAVLLAYNRAQRQPQAQAQARGARS